DRHLAGIGGHEAQDEPKHRRLPGAAAAEQDVRRVRRDGEGDAVERLVDAEALADAAEDDHVRRASTIHSRPWRGRTERSGENARSMRKAGKSTRRISLIETGNGGPAVCARSGKKQPRSQPPGRTIARRTSTYSRRRRGSMAQ